MISLPWWLSSHSPESVERVLRSLAFEQRVQFEGSDADIASRLLRNGYVRAEIESTVVGTEGPLALELESRGLTDLGRALLSRFSVGRAVR